MYTLQTLLDMNSESFNRATPCLTLRRFSYRSSAYWRLENWYWRLGIWDAHSPLKTLHWIGSAPSIWSTSAWDPSLAETLRRIPKLVGNAWGRWPTSFLDRGMFSNGARDLFADSFCAICSQTWFTWFITNGILLILLRCVPIFSWLHLSHFECSIPSWMSRVTTLSLMTELFKGFVFYINAEFSYVSTSTTSMIIPGVEIISIIPSN